MKNEKIKMNDDAISEMVSNLQKIAGKETRGWIGLAAERLGEAETSIRNATKGVWTQRFAGKVDAALTAMRGGAERDRLLTREAGSWAVGEPVDQLRSVSPSIAGEAVVTRMTAPCCIIYVKMTHSGVVEHRIRWIDDVQRDAEGVEGIVQKGIRLGVEHITARMEYEHREEDRACVEIRSGYTDEDIKVSTYQQLVNGNLSMSAAQARALLDRVYDDIAALRSKKDRSPSDHVQIGKLEMMREMARAALRDDEMTGAARSVIATYVDRPSVRRDTPREAAAPHQHVLSVVDTLEQLARGERELPPPPRDALDIFMERQREIMTSTAVRDPDGMAKLLFA